MAESDGVPQLGEHSGVPQPSAPIGTPATAAPATDQVTVNTHLRKVASEAHALVSYVENFLEEAVAKEVAGSLENVITVVEKNIK